MITDKCHIIWTSDFDVDDYRDDIVEEYGSELTENEIFDIAFENNRNEFENEFENLRIDLNREIICIGDLGLWHGRAHGYKTVKGTFISDCLFETCGDYVTFYVDELGDFRCKDCHHDGTNYYLFRVFKPGFDFWQKQNFKEKIYNGTASRHYINTYTERLGDYIADIYGFKIRKRNKRKVVA